MSVNSWEDTVKDHASKLGTNEETALSSAAVIDRIRTYIESNSELCDIIRAATLQPHLITIPFDPIGSSEVMDFFIKDPENFTGWLKAAVYEIGKSYRDTKTANYFKTLMKVEITSAPEIKMREWDTEHEGKPVAVNVMIVRQNKEETYTKFAELYCREGHRKKVSGTLYDPHCEECEKPVKMVLDMSTLKTGYYREVLIQEPMEEVTNGDARTLEAVIKDDDVRKTFVGQRKRIIGVFRSIPQKYKMTNKIQIQIISMKDADDLKEFEPTDEDIKYFHELEKRPDYDDIVVESIAPQIKHEFLAKICVLLTMIGAPRLDGTLGLIFTLLIGDPSTGKSDIIQYLAKIIRKYAYAVGGTASGSGVTVSMDTLPGGDKAPKAGIIPQCNNGGVGLDEINQLEEEDIGKMYTWMASAMIPYNKGGFDLNLQAYTWMVGGANPRYYIYNERHSIEDNLNLPAPFLSRFHLIVNMMRKRKSDIEKQQIYDHMGKIKQIGVTEYIKQKGLMQPELLGKYITYCKRFNPVFTDEALKMAKEFQLKMEKLEQDNGSLPIDPRFYDGILRMSQAVASRHFKNKVEPSDINAAIEIKKRTLATFGMNVEAGEFVMRFESDIKGQDAAFISTCQGLQKRNSDGRFSEDECIKSMHQQFPDEFQTIEKAAVYFAKHDGKLDKIAGRYKLA